MSNQRAHVTVSGLVQGVFFRTFTKENAEKLGLKGWVKNLPSGEVEAVVEGNKRKIENLLETLEIGPSAASVETVKVDWLDYEKEFRNFQILR